MQKNTMKSINIFELRMHLSLIFIFLTALSVEYKLFITLVFVIQTEIL